MPDHPYSPPVKTRSRRAMLAGVAAIVLLSCGCAEEKPRVYRVGILSGVDFFAGIADGFKYKMTELGYVEGRNIVYDLHKNNNDQEANRRSAQKFAADKKDLIFVFPTDAALTAKAATRGTNIPVVFAYATIEGCDLVKSLRSPGANVTGVRFPGPDLAPKRFELLMELKPQLRRLWIAYNPDYPSTKDALDLLRRAASSRGVTLVEVAATGVEGLEADLQARSASKEIGMDAMFIMPEALSQSPEGWAAIKKFADRHKVPIAGSSAFSARNGAIFGYAPDPIEEGRLAAPLADKVFRGIEAGTIPVVTPEPHLWINYRRCRELGLKAPEGLLRQAAEIIR